MLKKFYKFFSENLRYYNNDSKICLEHYLLECKTVPKFFEISIYPKTGEVGLVYDSKSYSLSIYFLTKPDRLLFIYYNSNDEKSLEYTLPANLDNFNKLIDLCVNYHR